MNVGWSVRQALPQFPQKLTFACGAISEAEGHSTKSLRDSSLRRAVCLRVRRPWVAIIDSRVAVLS
jgi:hypothetical protein